MNAIERAGRWFEKSRPAQFIVVFGILALIFIIGYLALPTADSSVVSLVGGGGERIYLNLGVIYAFKDDPEKRYDVVVGVVHVTSAQFARMVFFDTPEEAQAAGYIPSNDFVWKSACVEKGLSDDECYKTKPKESALTVPPIFEWRGVKYSMMSCGTYLLSREKYEISYYE